MTDPSLAPAAVLGSTPLPDGGFWRLAHADLSARRGPIPTVRITANVIRFDLRVVIETMLTRGRAALGEVLLADNRGARRGC